MTPRFFGVVVGLAIAFAATTASACTRDLPAGAGQVFVPEHQIDQSLLDSAVRSEVNFHRCKAGLSPLTQAQSALVSVAATHSEWMAQAGSLSHRSTVPGMSNLRQRISASRVKFRAGSENIGMVQRYQFGNLQFQILDRASCSFSSHDGTRVPPHSYASLAKYAVELWMASPKHRQNILDPKMTRVSTAAAFGSGQYCGQFWLTQNFVG